VTVLQRAAGQLRQELRAVTSGVYLTDGKGLSRFQLPSNMVAVLARENIKLADSKVSVRPQPQRPQCSKRQRGSLGESMAPTAIFLPTNR
jgi:hypothetical protein